MVFIIVRNPVMQLRIKCKRPVFKIIITSIITSLNFISMDFKYPMLQLCSFTAIVSEIES